MLIFDGHDYCIYIQLLCLILPFANKQNLIKKEQRTCWKILTMWVVRVGLSTIFQP
ncbi:hypothetical protein EMIT051CA3_10055 [Pseudomonas chlororaphis]